jgi:hypothetical protein
VAGVFVCWERGKIEKSTWNNLLAAEKAQTIQK